MPFLWNRRTLLTVGLPLFADAAQDEVPSWLPQEDPKLVQEMVAASHGNAKRVNELLRTNQSLVRATIDWGFGDWETALGAASHVGNREIAEALIEAGAETTIFSAAMLGQTEVVKAIIAANPQAHRKRGPHGITLLAHAKAGAAKAAEVASYLETLGGANDILITVPLSASDRDALVGKYSFGNAARDYFEVDVQKGQLGILRPGAPARRQLFHSGELSFFPSGAPWAKILFERKANQIVGFKLGALAAKRV